MNSLYEKHPKTRKYSFNQESSPEVAELRRLVQHFRVSELQELLQSFGHTRTGKKQILQSRAFALISKNANTVRAKINEINSRSHATFPNVAFSLHNLKANPSDATITTGVSMLHASATVSQELSSSQNHFTRSQTDLTTHSHTTPAVLHPDVRFTKPTFFEELQVLIRPTSLAAISKKNYPGNQGIHHESTIKFALSPQQLTHIKANMIELEDEVHSGDIKQVQTKYGVQLQLRFCLQETSCEQLDNFPINMHIKVNDKYISAPGYHPGLSNRPEYKRTGRPVDITALCRNVPPTKENIVQIYWTPDLYNIPTGHVVMCSLVQTINSNQLLNQLKTKAVRIADHSRALIKEKFKMSDSEVSATSYRVSLLCPLGKVKMNYPCRAKSCSHLQCFDAELYLQMNEKKSTWICPICDKPALYANLILDDLFTEILQQAKHFDEIEFDQDGSWYSISDRGEKGRRMPNLFPIPLNSHQSENKPPIILELSPSSDSKSSSDNSDSSDSYISSPSSPPAPPYCPPETEKESNYIDLTLDSDTESDEEGPTSTTRTVIPPTAYHGQQRSHIRFDSPSLREMTSSLTTESTIPYLPQHPITSPLTKTHHPITNNATNSGAHNRKHPISPVQQTQKRYKAYQSPTDGYLPSLPPGSTLAPNTALPSQLQTQQRSPDSTTDSNNANNISYVSYPTYVQVPLSLDQSTPDTLSSAHSSQQSNSPQSIANIYQYASYTTGYSGQMLPFQNLDGQDLATLDLLSLPMDNLYSIPQGLSGRASPNLLQTHTPENILLTDPQLAPNQGHIYHIPSTAHHSYGLVEEDGDHTPIVRLQAPPDAYDDADVISIDCPSN